jgi:hypothetical protein
MADLKPYIATITRTIPLVACNDKHAYEIAEQFEREDAGEPDITVQLVTKVTQVPSDCLHAIPWGNTPDDRRLVDYIKEHKD